MTLEQEIRLAAKHAAQAAAEKASKEAYEKAHKEAEKEKELAVKKAAFEEKMESARKLKAKNIPDDVIAECVGLSLEEVKAL